MTRRAFIQKYFLRFAVSLALLGLIVYTVYHVFGSTSGSLQMHYVRKRTDIQIVSAEAYLFREEQVLTVPSKGLIHDLSQSGKKVSKDTALAAVWSSDLDAEALAAAQTELDHLNRMIRVLENSLVSADTTLSKAELYRAGAMKDRLTIRRALASGDWSGLRELEDDMLALLNRYAALTGSADAVPALLESMRQERSAMLQGTFTTLRNTESSGYYYNRACVDGYESIFTTAVLEGLTPQSFAELRSLPPKETEAFVAGKMVYGNRWHLALTLDGAVEEMISVGTRYSFTFPENRDKVLNMTCTNIQTADDGSILAVFASDEVPSDFTYLRVQTVEITVGECTGYDVPEAAMRTVDGVLGVYVFEDSTIRFRRVEVLYRGDGYYIVAEQGDRGDDFLALGDIIVTSGNDLYDGKVFQ